MNLYKTVLVYYLTFFWQALPAFDGRQLVRDVASRLCPYTNFCHVNSSQVITSNSFHSCCAPCYCNDDCWELNNCCPDKEPPDFPPRVMPCLWSEVLYDISFKNTDEKYYRIVNECPESFQNTTVGLKCNGTVETDLEDFVWVSDTVTGRIFKNRHCAVCYNLTKYDHWQIKVKCSGEVEINSASWQNLFSSEKCYIINKPPNKEFNIFTRYECFRRSKHTYNSCNATGLWKEFDYDIEHACLLSTWPYYQLGKMQAVNVFCKLCNTGGPADISTFCLDGKLGDLSSQPFSILLNMDEKSATKETPEKTICKVDEVIDEYKALCRKLICPPGQIPFYGSCKVIALEVNGLCVHIPLRLQIVFHETLHYLNDLPGNMTRSLGSAVLEHFVEATGFTKAICSGVRSIYLLSSIPDGFGSDIVLFISLKTTPSCQFMFVVNRTMAIVGKQTSISFDSGSSNSLVIIPKFELRSREEIFNNTYSLAIIGYINDNYCQKPYRLKRSSACPKVKLDHTEAITSLEITHFARLGFAQQLGDLSMISDVEICYEDYVRVMSQINLCTRAVGGVCVTLLSLVAVLVAVQIEF